MKKHKNQQKNGQKPVYKQPVWQGISLQTKSYAQNYPQQIRVKYSSKANPEFLQPLTSGEDQVTTHEQFFLQNE